MKKILFMCINMNIGGTEKALLNMIDEIQQDKWEVTILMLEEYGGFIKAIPDWIVVKYVKDFEEINPILNQPPIQVVREYIKKGKLIRGFNIATLHLISKLVGHRSIYFKYVLKYHPKILEEYDIAVAYAGPMDFITYFVLNKIRAKKKIQWIHFDITKIGFNLKFANKFYNEFNNVFVVSEEGKCKLIEKVPNLKDKTEVFYNIVSSKTILKLGDLATGFEDEFDGIRILTVGRLSKEKGQDLTIKALAKLKKDGYKIRWYCIGDGMARVEYEKIIKKYKLEDDYIILGAKTNPYPYMKECDIYVQSSRHEGYCITLAEARCFNNPIVTTNFTGANEQINNEVNGLVCNISEADIYRSLKRLLDDKQLYENIKYNLAKECINSTNEIKKLENLL
ncbi:glycosyltransferase [Clostridium perfringens]|nr:glycosyltransferase [Clostridium perfringens]MDM0931862.1 glycosyltransferase [Clostridium perfringens]MDU4500681.1 glycosyltransferase [Clostridium perfringens]